MPTTKDYLLKKYQRNAIDEFLAKELRNAEYGGVELRRTPLGDRVILRVGRVGFAIGGRGRNIHRITERLREDFSLENPQIEVTEVENPEVDPRIMAYRLASSLERGRHFRRSAHGIIRRILSAGAKGVEIIISGKVTSQRARVESFRAGFVAKCGEPASKYVDVGKAQALIKRGLIGVQVRIMQGDAILPDDIEIIAEPTSTSMIVVTEGEEPEIMEEITEGDIEEVFEELEEFPEIEDIAEETKKIKDEFDELDEVDKAPKVEKKAPKKEKEAPKKEKEAPKKEKEAPKVEKKVTKEEKKAPKKEKEASKGEKKAPKEDKKKEKK
jgi:small subunit ribosomal protein S3